MSSYLSNLLTNTTSRYNSLRRTLLESEADGDTEDDTHICRVLRAYYLEKGKPFPQWLPPDPKAPQAMPTQFVTSGRTQAAAGGRGGGLSDLWDGPQQSQPPQEQASLRRGAATRGGAAGRTLQPPGRPSMVDSYSEQRPLPSQRAGSYQSQMSQNRADMNASPAPSGGGSAQERLKARLWGSGRSTSPAPSTASSQSSASNPSFSQAGAQVAFDRGNSYSSAQSDRNNSYGSASGGGRSGGGNPYVSANSPWAGGDDNYGGGAYDNSGRSYGAPQRPPGNGRSGLPSGPRMR
ncbi:hypothetical protein EJ05DRAFT_478521 [Pseudovirgaria hyperparasitica]|uniref:Mso1 N-terminal domain-containing protein n=1 Tax=Pseudovirgaria hyperparasitica TaxID=470096 RepID=A0A6A6VY39_9PEZI|nr:uncharacterized protein EJ05DRAFT_478521 [Pseudovirgaria hyperparasitica]KAF2755532.1 hypothetical protein EJ05DRAFT_478521 [Pseudovirgaria hyperparasitica]